MDLNKLLGSGILNLQNFLYPLVFFSPRMINHYLKNNTSTSFTVAHVYVDDVLMTGDSISDIEEAKKALHAKFTIKDLGNFSYFLRMEICITGSGIFINHRKYTLDILKDFDVSSLPLSNTLLPFGLKLDISAGCSLPDPSIYRKLIGKLLYLSLTRPDISYGIQHLSQFLVSPKDSHL